MAKKSDAFGKGVECCFCGVSLKEPDAVLLVVYPDSDRDMSQSFYAHRHCFSQVFIPTLRPGFPVFDPEWDRDSQT